MTNYFLLQRTGLEICNLQWPANFSTMMFSPSTCATSFKMTLIHWSMLSRISWVLQVHCQSKRCTIGSLAQLNSMVSSWTTNGKATTAGSLLVFEDNVGEDGLSSQSTYKVNIDCPYYKEAIAPNSKVMNSLKSSKE